MAQVRTNHIAEQYEFAGTGEIYSYTVVQDAPEGYEEQAPYFLALVKLDVCSGLPSEAKGKLHRISPHIIQCIWSCVRTR